MNPSDWIDDDESQGYSGTFRWKATKKLPSLPKRTVRSDAIDDLTEASWINFFLSRFATESEGMKMLSAAHADMSLIDCLSSPLTIAYMCHKIGIGCEPSPKETSKLPTPLSRLIIVCIGASAKAEERVLRETNCWHEIQHCFPETAVAHVELWLVGPEISATESPYDDKGTKNTTPSGPSSRVSFHLFRGTSIDFFRAYPSKMNSVNTPPSASSRTVVAGLNCGFGNWEAALGVERRYDLLFAWLPDLVFLTSTRLPLLFTCANDYADVAGETLVMSSMLGASYLIPPDENKMSYASTLVQNVPKRPKQGKNKGSVAQAEQDEGYSRGNSFFYAVQGHDKASGRRQKLNLKSKLECITVVLRTVHAQQQPGGAVDPRSLVVPVDLEYGLGAAGAAAVPPPAAPAAPTASKSSPQGKSAEGKQPKQPDAQEARGGKADKKKNKGSTAATATATAGSGATAGSTSSASAKAIQQEYEAAKALVAAAEKKRRDALEAVARHRSSVEEAEAERQRLGAELDRVQPPVPSAEELAELEREAQMQGQGTAAAASGRGTAGADPLPPRPAGYENPYDPVSAPAKKAAPPPPPAAAASPVVATLPPPPVAAASPVVNAEDEELGAAIAAVAERMAESQFTGGVSGASTGKGNVEAVRPSKSFPASEAKKSAAKVEPKATSAHAPFYALSVDMHPLDTDGTGAGTVGAGVGMQCTLKLRITPQADRSPPLSTADIEFFISNDGGTLCVQLPKGIVNDADIGAKDSGGSVDPAASGSFRHPLPGKVDCASIKGKRSKKTNSIEITAVMSV